MAPKKASAFMVFTIEWKEKHGRHMNIAQATSAAGELWKKMTLKQREPYLKRANGSNVQQKQKQKLTCNGTPVLSVEKELEEKERIHKSMMQTIEKTIKTAVEQNMLEQQKFFFVMVNYFTRLPNSENYVPAEIAIIEFSLIEGVRRKYHKFINPNIDLYGNTFEAQIHSETTHQLPLPPNAMGESDSWKISSEILAFILDEDDLNFESDFDTDSLPPLYTHTNEFLNVKSSLSFLATNPNDEDHLLSKLNIYSIQELFYALKCATCDIKSIQKPCNRFATDCILDRDSFEYSNNIACHYHDKIDRPNYCALSQVCRWGFAFADYMGMDMSITFLSGRHMPDNVNAEIVNGFCDFSEHQNNNDLCGAMSEVSLKSNYQSWDEFDQCSRLTSHSKGTSQTACKPIMPKTTTRANDSSIDYIYSEPSYNPFKRHDDSKPPESSFFDIDYESYNHNRSFNTTRRVVRGRGIVIYNSKSK